MVVLMGNGNALGKDFYPTTNRSTANDGGHRRPHRPTRSSTTPTTAGASSGNLHTGTSSFSLPVVETFVDRRRHLGQWIGRFRDRAREHGHLGGGVGEVDLAVEVAAQGVDHGRHHVSGLEGVAALVAQD